MRGTRTVRGSLVRQAMALCIAAAAALAAGCAGASSQPGGDDDDDDFADAGNTPRPDADPAAPDADPAAPDAEVNHGDDDADVDPPDIDADVPPPTDPDLVDDLNDGNDLIRNVGGRVGTWFTFHDDTVGGVQVPPGDFAPMMPGADGAGYAARTTGHGFTEWGAGIGFDLATPSSATLKGKYNGGAYTGVKFKAKGTVPIRFSIQIAAVLETGLGGTCIATTTPGMECDDVHGKSVSLTTSWAEYNVPFSQLTQEGWGKMATFDKATMTAMHFQTLPGVTFDVSVDDIRFY